MPDSDVVTTVLPLVGVWVGRSDAAESTTRGYPYGKATRSDSSGRASVDLQLTGRARPITEYGEALTGETSVTIPLPYGDTHTADLAALRERARDTSTQTVRDSRSRVAFGPVRGMTIADTSSGAIASFTVPDTDYTDGTETTVTPEAAGDYTYYYLTSPARTDVYRDGVWVATLTDGCRTALTLRPAGTRTLTEQKGAFADDFDRTIASGWGSSPGGGVWGTFGGSAGDYTVASGAGQITLNTTNTSRYTRLNDTTTTYNVVAAVQLSALPTGSTVSVAVIGGWTDTSNHYRYRLTISTSGSVTAAITKNVTGTETSLVSRSAVVTGVTSSTILNVRAVFDGVSGHALTVWKSTDSEPGTPTVSATDTTFLSGKLGIRAFAASAVTNTVTVKVLSYTGSSVAWPDPPSVDTPYNVRILPAPYSGTPDTATVDTIVTDTTGDVLDDLMALVTGGTDDTGYGPLYAPGRSWDTGHADDGTRQEGSDFNDKIGTDWTYTDLASSPVTDNAEAHQAGCLDCSGMVRYVLGYLGGLPLCLDDAADYDGRRIPRRSTDQATSGPGVIIAQASGTAPSLTLLQPGDLLYWDADTTNPNEEEGQIDHAGVYLGIDGDGNRRFISSRKTANGPTMADLGGPSILDGTGLYARSLRTIRRA